MGRAEMIVFLIGYILMGLLSLHTVDEDDTGSNGLSILIFAPFYLGMTVMLVIAWSMATLWRGRRVILFWLEKNQNQII